MGPIMMSFSKRLWEKSTAAYQYGAFYAIGQEKSRAKSRGKPRFLERAARMGYAVVDASRPVEDVHAAILKEVLPLLLSVSDLPAKK